MQRRTGLDNMRSAPLLLMAGALIVLARVSGSEPIPAAGLRAFEGVWQRAELEANDAERVAAIESATRDMPFWARGIARGVMRIGMTPTERYTIQLTESGLLIAHDDEAPRPFRLEAAPALTDAETDRARMRWIDGALLEHWNHGEDSYGTTQWAVTETRQLVVTVTAFDSRLREADGKPRAIRYSTLYSRARDAIRAPAPE